MTTYTHAIFTEDGRFKDWICYGSGQYELERGNWYATMASELETFLSNEHLVVPFDELTDGEWIVIRISQALAALQRESVAYAIASINTMSTPLYHEQSPEALLYPHMPVLKAAIWQPLNGAASSIQKGCLVSAIASLNQALELAVVQVKDD